MLETANFGQAISLEASSPKGFLFFVSKTYESEMKTRSPDYIEEHYVTKPAAALMVLFL